MKAAARAEKDKDLSSDPKEDFATTPEFHMPNYVKNDAFLHTNPNEGSNFPSVMDEEADHIGRDTVMHKIRSPKIDEPNLKTQDVIKSTTWDSKLVPASKKDSLDSPSLVVNRARGFKSNGNGFSVNMHKGQKLTSASGNNASYSNQATFDKLPSLLDDSSESYANEADKYSKFPTEDHVQAKVSLYCL